MIVGGYSLHLYCDAKLSDLKPCNVRAENNENVHTEWAAITEMRKRGWSINTKRQVCYCPQHNLTKKPKAAPTGETP